MDAVQPPSRRRIVVIAAPHAACAQVRRLQPYAHLCDAAVDEMAECIGRHLQGGGFRGQVKVHTHINREVARPHCDMNRAECSESPYRAKLRKDVLDNRDRVSFVLDLHSFPPGKGAFGRPDPELVVLDDNIATGPEVYSLDFVAAMKRAGIRTRGPLSGQDNDVHAEMRRQKIGVRSFLLEAREEMGQARMDQVVCPAIARWLASQTASDRNKGLEVTWTVAAATAVAAAAAASEE